MSTGSISDVLTRVSQIEQQIQSLDDGSMLDQALGITDTGGTAGTSSTGDSSGSSSSSGSDFSSALSQAQNSSGSSSSSVVNSALSGVTNSIDALTGGSSVGVALPSSSSTLLTSSQQQFASTLSADTGLNPSVVSAWLLAEESGSAAAERQAANNNDWLNIGYTDSGTYGASDSVWANPVSAANATAQWLKGERSVPGYGTASSGIQAILQSVGQTPAAQIAALQNSGWSSGGYPSLGTLYAQVVGS